MQNDSAPQQHNSQSMESLSPSGGSKSKKILLIVLVAVLAAGLSGASVWAYMSNQNDSNKKSLNAQITTKNTTITGLQTNVKSLETKAATITTTTSVTGQQATTSTGMFESLVAFCGVNGNTVQYATLTNEIDGKNYFGHCAIMEKGMLTGGYIITARYVNSTWEKIYSGQDSAASSVCTQYKIPTILGTCS